MDLSPGDWVGFLAGRDRRIFRISSPGADVIHLECPCCGLRGQAPARDLFRLGRNEIMTRLGLAVADLTLDPAAERASVRVGRKPKGKSRAGRRRGG